MNILSSSVTVEGANVFIEYSVTTVDFVSAEKS